MAITLPNFSIQETSLYHSIELLKGYRMIPRIHKIDSEFENYCQKMEEKSKINSSQPIEFLGRMMEFSRVGRPKRFVKTRRVNVCLGPLRGRDANLRLLAATGGEGTSVLPPLGHGALPGGK